MNSTITAYGWTPFFESQRAADSPDGALPARVVLAQRGVFRVQAAAGGFDAVLSGRFRHHADGALEGGAGDLPVVGDWVICHCSGDDGPALIDGVLRRHSKLSRKVAGARAVEQVLAANLDWILIVMGLDNDFNLRRLERYLVMARESGARPLVVLNKADLAADAEGRRTAAEAVASDVPVLVLSALSGRLDALRQQLLAGETVALVGSSGAGKSTLINRLAGEELMRTGAVRDRDHRGQHTTTHRELLLLPDGLLLIDSPGLRELQLWRAEGGLDDAFGDVLRLAKSCRFGDCSHGAEPGCAVRAAIEAGALDSRRLDNLQGLQREAAALAARRDVRTRRAADKRLGKLYKRIQREKRERRE